MARSVFQLIDLDRTIFDTSMFAKALTDEINISEPGVGTKLDELFETAYEKEQTFFLLRYLRDERGDAWFEDLVARAMQKIDASSLLLDGVKERLVSADGASSHRPAWGIFTYGDEIDQRMKARLIGMEDVPLFLTDTPDKATVITSWKTTDGTFKLPEEFGGGVVDYITLEDDKIRAFKGLPDGSFGFWVTKNPDANALLAEVNGIDAPAKVVAVSDLSDVTRSIKKIL